MSKSKRNAKVGRNDPCPCGSGVKYKRCHGRGRISGSAGYRDQIDNEIQYRSRAIESRLLQRTQQQGKGRPIISEKFKDYRFVAVGNTVHHSKKWKTFHDFLFDYLKIALGEKWGNLELGKPPNERHPILRWYELLCKHQQAVIKKPGAVYSAPMTGAGAAYLHLAYNLYLITHNITIQELLIERIKKIDQFRGALYETYVAAAFIKAGFQLEFERETDSKKSHCEFAATYTETGRRFSVEAKCRMPGKTNTNIANQLHAALKKEADHDRIIFIDINISDAVNNESPPEWMLDVVNTIRSREASMTINNLPAPSAYLFITNHPFEYHLSETDYQRGIISEGFKIPDFQLDAEFSSLRHALSARDRHIEMFHLMESLRTHYTIPSTFDGEISEFAFHDGPPWLQIGQRYMVPYERDKEAAGELIDATVMKGESLVYGLYSLDNGQTIMATTPMTENEISAYEAHPDTFFGRHRPKHKKANSLLDLYDFFYDTYQHSDRDQLLAFLSKHTDIDSLRSLSQKELAITYCEGLVYGTMTPNKPTD